MTAISPETYRATYPGQRTPHDLEPYPCEVEVTYDEFLMGREANFQYAELTVAETLCGDPDEARAMDGYLNRIMHRTETTYSHHHAQYWGALVEQANAQKRNLEALAAILHKSI